MPHLLHIDSSILGEKSTSRRLSAAVVTRLKQTIPNLLVTYRDLCATAVPHLTGASLAAHHLPMDQLNDDLRADLAFGATVIDEFLKAEVLC